MPWIRTKTSPHTPYMAFLVSMSSVLAMLMWFRKNLTSNGTSGSANKYTSLINTHVNKSYKTQQEQVTSKETKLSTIRFCRALDNSKQAVTTYFGVPAFILHLSILL